MFIVVSQEQMILLIREYVFDNMIPKYTYYNVKKKYFQEQSYLLWAADELIKRISEQKTESPIKSLEDFAIQMSRFSTMNPKTKYAFEIAYNLSSNILDVCRSAGWLNQ